MPELIGEKSLFDFSSGVVEALKHAHAFALSHEGQTGPVELLVGLARTRGSDAEQILSPCGINEGSIRRWLPSLSKKQVSKTQELKDILQRATEKAAQNQRQVDTSYLLWALVQEKTGLLSELFEAMAIDRNRLIEEAAVKLTVKYMGQSSADFNNLQHI